MNKIEQLSQHNRPTILAMHPQIMFTRTADKMRTQNYKKVYTAQTKNYAHVKDIAMLIFCKTNKNKVGNEPDKAHARSSIF